LPLPEFVKRGIHHLEHDIIEALREALANCLVNADYFGSRGIVVTLHAKTLTFANPCYSRTGKIQMLRGGVSDPRNRGLMKMFNLVDIGERAGSGIPSVTSQSFLK